MADWTDGPEYAPTARPSAFVAPVAAVLESPQPEPSAVPDGVPGAEPSFVPPEQPTPDLRALVPSAAPGRNPNLPFESTTTPLTSTEPAASRSPLEPFASAVVPLAGSLTQPALQPTAQINPAPLPMSMAQQWAPPAPGSVVQPQRVTAGQIWQGTTGWVLVPLLIGMFLTPVSPIALAVAAISSAQIAYRRVAVRRSFLYTCIAVVVIPLFVIAADETADFWSLLATLSQVACWLLALVAPGLVGAALRSGERPEGR